MKWSSENDRRAFLLRRTESELSEMDNEDLIAQAQKLSIADDEWKDHASPRYAIIQAIVKKFNKGH